MTQLMMTSTETAAAPRMLSKIAPAGGLRTVDESSECGNDVVGVRSGGVVDNMP